MNTLAPNTSRTLPLDSRASAARALVLLFLADAVVLLGSALISESIRFGSEPRSLSLGGITVGYSVFSVGLTAVWLGLLSIITAVTSKRRSHHSMRRFADAVLSTVILIAAYALFATATQTEVSRGYLLIAVPLGLLGLTATRVISARLPQRSVPIMLVGTAAEICTLRDRLSRGAEPTETVGELVLDDKKVTASGDIVLANGQRLTGNEFRELVAMSDADAVVITSGAESNGDSFVESVNWALHGSGTEIMIVPEFGRIPLSRLDVMPYGDSVIGVIRTTRYRGLALASKRIIDLVLSAAALIVLSPLLLVIAIVVRRSGPGPVVFTQERVGRGGKPFTIFKFRTMVANAEDLLDDLVSRNESDGPLFKIREDPRVTPIGQFLRKWSLDELPQLVNVFRGEMSLVGPRPALPSEVAQYSPAAHRRLLVVPGITGPWQISGRSDLTWKEGLGVDLFYIDNWSAALDARIVASTFVVVLARKGAY